MQLFVISQKGKKSLPQTYKFVVIEAFVIKSEKSKYN